MPLEQKLYTALTGSTLVTSLTTRVYPLRAPQNPGYPHIVYTRIGGNQYNGLSGYQTVEKPSIQIDVYSTSYTQVKSLAENIHTALDGTTTFRAILITDTDLFEEEIDKYRILMDFSMINHE